MTARSLQRVVRAVPALDGAGVRLLRSLGQALGTRQSIRFDPFLLLDEFSSANPEDYLAGFPAHPHRGFETVTYMLEGRMLHEDHLGHRGELESGGVQWMTAGRGIVHSEMPLQAQGRMRGFQLWLNLPAREKMRAPEYVDLRAREIPEARFGNGTRVRVIAGTLLDGNRTMAGPIAGRSTDPLYLDVHLPAHAQFSHEVARGHHAFVYPYEGVVQVGDGTGAHRLEAHTAGLLSDDGEVRVAAQGEGARLLVLAARPLGEPIVQYGPFVMNTLEEIEQAARDFESGEFTRGGPPTDADRGATG